MGYLDTYEIEEYTVIHPTEGELTKQKIIYYDLYDNKITEEFFFGFIISGYSEKN